MLFLFVLVCFPACEYHVHLYVFDVSTVSFSLVLAVLTSLLSEKVSPFFFLQHLFLGVFISHLCAPPHTESSPLLPPSVRPPGLGTVGCRRGVATWRKTVAAHRSRGSEVIPVLLARR